MKYHWRHEYLVVEGALDGTNDDQIISGDLQRYEDEGWEVFSISEQRGNYNAEWSAGGPNLIAVWFRKPRHRISSRIV